MSAVKKIIQRFESQADLGVPGWWRYILSLISIVVGSILFSLPFVVALVVTKIDFTQLSQAKPDEVQAIIEKSLGNLATAAFDSPISIFLLLASSGVGLIGVWFALRVIHKRTLLSAITTQTKFSWSRVWTGFWVYGLVSLLLIVLGTLLGNLLGEPNTIVWTNPNPLHFAGFLLLLLPLLFFQVTFEEVLFRGYIFQSVYKMVHTVQHKLFPKQKMHLTITVGVALLVSVVLFGLAHLENGPFKAGIWVALGYFSVAVFLQWITYKDQRLELAIGAHLANNFLAFGIISNTLDGGGISLFSDTATASAVNTPITFFIGLIPYALFYWIVFTLVPKLTKKPNNV